MELTKREIELIGRVQRAASVARFTIVVMLIFVGLGFIAFLTGNLDARPFAILCVVASMGSILAPQIGGPNYQELADLLSKVSAGSERIEKDPLVEALTKQA